MRSSPHCRACRSNAAAGRSYSSARASGGRMYSPDSSVDLAAVYDDLVENLRVRYVITYKSTARPEEHGPRTVRVELVDSRTSGPLSIVDADAKPVHPRALVDGRYDPAE